MVYRFLIAVIILVAALTGGNHSARAQGKSLIGDTEIENTLRAFAAPIFKAAGLNAADVEIYIVNDDSLNAFVAGGQKLFVNAGLIMQSDSANQIIGVIAHETGHIAGGHLSRVHDELSRTSATSILAAIVGGAAAIATGRGDIGAAVAAGGQQVAVRNFLAYSRTQEGAADHAALGFLDNTGQSARGLLEFMNKLGDQELLSTARQDPYVRSHPLTRDRIDTIEHHVAESPHSSSPEPPEFERMYKRMKAKLYGFLNSYALTVRKYPESDNAVDSRYARAIAQFRRVQLAPALELMDGLIAEHPNDPYFHELRGQMLFENGRVDEALVSYTRAAELLPDAPLIRRELARTQLETNDPALLDAAIGNFEIALSKDRTVASNWRFLAIAYGRKGELPRSYLALGEEALNLGKPDIARYQATRARDAFPRGSREWLQAEDILLAADDLERRLKRAKGQ